MLIRSPVIVERHDPIDNSLITVASFDIHAESVIKYQ